LNVQETLCRLIIFSYPSFSPIRTYKFFTKPIFEMYDTNEVVDSLPDENEESDFEPYPLVDDTREDGEDDDEDEEPER
jgi:hypothetical protein